MSPPMVSITLCVYNSQILDTYSITDIVRTRVRTFGVEEHRFIMESGMISTTPLYFDWV